jgi:hypothetical protein
MFLLFAMKVANELRIDAAEDDKSKGRDKVPPHLSELN